MLITPAILVVDDSAANRRLYQAILSDLGADLFMAGTGEEALALYAERSYAMVLLDVHLAGMDGFEVARRLRDSQQALDEPIDTPIDTPIVFVSALYVHEKDTFQGYRLGAVDYILSPVVPEIVRAKASVFIRLFRMRREAEAQTEAVEKVYRELRIAHADMEGFSYSVSHDLRTPLGQILGFAELLAQGSAGELSSKALEYLGYMQSAADRMNDLINDMLVLANMTRNDTQLEPINVSGMVHGIAEELKTAQPSNKRVAFDVQPHLMTRADPRLLRLALANLLSNAWKYSANVDAPKVQVGQIERAEGPLFFVRDNGAGFDMAVAGERLFRPFQRFHPDSVFRGNGVGLAIVQRVVLRHGGQIWAESVPGQGATFFFTLAPPAAPVSAVSS